MFRKFLFISLICLSTAMIVWSGQYIYQKQSKAINFNSFSLSDSASTFYVPNVNELLKQNLNQLKNLNFPEEISKGVEKILVLKSYNFNTIISNQLYISYNQSSFILVLKNENLTFNKIIDELLNQFKISAIYKNGKLNFNQHSYFVDKVNSFIAISNKPISIKEKQPQINTTGHFHYLSQNGINAKQIFVKLKQNDVLSFSKSYSDSIKGKAVSPFNYFKITPSNFSKFNFYGSSRFIDDYPNLIGNKKKSDFFNWIKSGFLFIEKDGMQLIIGQQNEQQNLKNILDEQTLELSPDSLLPTPIFKNNMEISFFKSHFEWGNLLPQSKERFSLYTEFNDYNILANSMQAMNWFIKANQLGDVYSKNKPELKISKKVNRLSILQSDSAVTISMSNRLNNSTTLKTNIVSTHIESQSQNILELAHSFLISDAKSDFISFTKNDSLYILMYNNQAIDCYNMSGKLLWSKELNSPLIESPQKITRTTNVKIVLFMQNQVDILNSEGSSENGFPYQYNGASNHALVVKYKDQNKYRLLIQVNNSIINLNLQATPVEGWSFNGLKNKLKSSLSYGSKNGKDYIYFKDKNDSLIILNRRGENRFSKKFIFNLKNESPYLTGDISKNNLRKINYENGYIKSKYAVDGHKDSIKTQSKYNPTAINWIMLNDKLTLIIEEFDRVVLLNEFGFVEQEIQKPQPNLTYILPVNGNDNFNVFANIQKNELYLLNRFGNQLNTKPILGNENFFFENGYFIVYFNSQIWLYKLN